MELKLRFPPTPEYAAEHAALMVAAARRISGVELDFSPESLNDVDQIIEGFRRDGVSVDRVASTLFCCGCYVDEVFVRNAAGRWRLTEETSMKDLAGFPMVVELGPDRYCNPIAKVFKRLEYGEEDNLPYFYHVFTQGDDVPLVPPARPKRPSFWRRLLGGS